MSNRSRYKKISKKPMEQAPVQQKQHAVVKKQKTDIFTEALTRKNLMILSAIICGVTFITFLPTLFCQFTNLDDQYYILDNPDIKGLTFKFLKTMFTNYYVGNYEPIAMLTYAIEYKIAGLSPFIYHFTNFVLHLLNTFLVFIFIRKLSGNNLIAALTSILFGIHPLHLESVAWVSERKDVLYAFFYIAGLVSWLRFRESKDWKIYVLTLMLFLFSCMSKAMAVWFTLVLILIDFLLDKNISFKLLINKIPFFIISAFFGLLAIHVQKVQGASTFINNVGGIYSTVHKIFLANYSLFFYFYKMLIPSGLAVIHPYPNIFDGRLPLIYYIAPVVNIVIFGLVIFSLKYSRKVVFGYLFFFVNIFQVLQVLSIGSAIAADRYFYISSIGIFYFIAVGFNGIYSNPKYAGLRQFLLFIASSVIIVYAIITFNRVHVWKNSGELWTDMIKTYPNNELPYFNRGGYYFELKQKDLALNDFTSAIDKYPKYTGAIVARLTLLLEKKDNDKAIQDLSRLIELVPGKSEYYIRQGILYRETQQNKLAMEDFEKAMKIDPTNFACYMNIAIQQCIDGKFDMASKNFNKAIELSPKTAELYSNRGNMYTMMNNPQKAIEDYTRSLSMDSTLTFAYLYRAFLYFDMKEYDKASHDLKIVLRKEPNNPNANLKMSLIYTNLNDKKNALEYAMRAKSNGLNVDEKYIQSLQ